jgi:hypothetical protein
VDTFMKVYCGYMHEDYCGYMHEDLLWIHSWRFTVDTFMKIYCGYIYEDILCTTIFKNTVV